jgi:hypothetical protein
MAQSSVRKREKLQVAGQCVIVASGSQTQSVNVCAGPDENSEKQLVVRLRQPFFTSAGQLESRAFRDVNELEAYLLSEHGGELERPKHGTLGRLSERLAAISADLDGGKPSPRPTVRQLLKWAGARRRGPYVVQGIRQSLDDNGLETYPDFEAAYVDSRISFQKVPDAVQVRAEEVPLREASAPQPEQLPPDPAFLVSRLKAFEGDVPHLAPTDPLELATTRLLADGVDALPVMTGLRSPKGVISWRSIGRRLALERSAGTVADFMDRHVEVEMTDELSTLVELVSVHGFVLVRSKSQNNEIVGSITAGELAGHLDLLDRPFRVIGEIERWLRLLVERHLDGVAAADPEDVAAADRSAPNLTLGECQRWLEEDEHWAAVGMPLDRSEFISRLDKVRSIRNSIMHFNTDAIDEDLETLGRFARLLQAVVQRGRP